MSPTPTPDHREWKSYWRDLEKDPNFRRETRREKRRHRKAHHKRRRRAERAQLERLDNGNWSLREGLRGAERDR